MVETLEQRLHDQATIQKGVFVETATPRVSVVMPTYLHAGFIGRALESLQAQTFTDWELIIFNDASPDETALIVAPFLSDARIHYHQEARNLGVGAALNHATSLAQGTYIAYLPSDDVYYPEHLARLVALLDERPDVYLAYNGVRWHQHRYDPTLQGKGAVGRERDTLTNPPQYPRHSPIPSGNILALVQVMHRRNHEAVIQWTPRTVKVSDELETDFWRGLLDAGAAFAYTGEIACEWLDHPDQGHKRVALHQGGLSRYRAQYGIGQGEWLNWQPSYGMQVNERERYGRFAVERSLPTTGGLKIMLVGELGFNPERIMAFEERGHKLYGLWMPNPDTWDTAGPLPYGNIENVPFDHNWRARVQAIRPDVLYGLLNVHPTNMLDEVLGAQLGIPLVYHIKESGFMCLEQGTWPKLARLLRQSDAQVFISAENQQWFEHALGQRFDPALSMILDGDPPKIDWFTDDWAPKLSAQDGEIHTVCPGRPLGLDPFEEIAASGIHVHFYGRHFQQWFPDWTHNSKNTGHMHLHPTVEPQDWVKELSQYDAAWTHIFRSNNNGDLRRAKWDDLNLPARLGTFAAAGLPWIMRDNRPSLVAIQRIAEQYDFAVAFRDFADLAGQLRDRPRLEELTANARKHRFQFAFDTHVDELVNLFRRAIATRG